MTALAVGGCLLLSSGPAERDPIRVGTSDIASSLDPAGAYDVGSWALFNNVYQTLLTFPPGSSTPQPDAARSCHFLDGNLQEFQCELREGLVFSNDRPITAEAVKFSFDRIFAINSPAGPAPLFSTLDSVSVDGRKVTFHLRARDATFPSKIATAAAAIVDPIEYSKNHIREDGGMTGSGPYLLTGRDKSGIQLEPNPRYHGAAKTGLPIHIRYFEDAQALDRAWSAREIDVAHRTLPPAMLAGLNSSDPSLHVSTDFGTETRNLGLNLRKGSPMARTEVRRAVAATLDRSSLAYETYQGTVEPLYSIIPKGITAHSTAFFDVSPEANHSYAAGLLRLAEVDTPVRFTLGYRTSESAEAEAEEIKRQLEADGLFSVKLIPEPDGVKYQQNYTTGAYDAFTFGWV
ncbi:ABC transporter substrate-binding protein, partial [Streptomyces chryseus]